MLLNNFIVEATLLCILLLFQQTEAKRLGHKRRTKHHGKKVSLHKPYQLRGSNVNKIESGHRRQFLTDDNAFLQQVSGQQTVSSQTPAILTGNKALPSQRLIERPSSQSGISLNQLSNDVKLQGDLAKHNLPLVDNNFLPNGIEVEKPLPIPYKKPAIRLVPKLVPLAYTKKPDVHVSHVHYDQGGGCV